MSNQEWLSPILDEMEEALGRFFRHFHTRLEEKGGLSPSQFFLLKHLQCAPRTVSDLAGRLSMTAAGATGLVDRLVKQSLVVRRRDETDRRIVWVELSPEGAAELARGRQMRREILQEFFSHLDPSEAQELLRLYKKMGASIMAPAARDFDKQKE